MTYVCNEGGCYYKTYDSQTFMEHMMEHGYTLLEAAELAKDIRGVNHEDNS